MIERRLAAGNHRAFQVGVVGHTDLKPAVPGQDGALLGDAFEVAVDLALAGTQAAAHLAVAHAHGAAQALVFAGVGTGVLQGFNAEGSSHLGDDLRPWLSLSPSANR